MAGLIVVDGLANTLSIYSIPVVDSSVFVVVVVVYYHLAMHRHKIKH